MNRKQTVKQLEGICERRNDGAIEIEQSQFEARVVLLQFVEQYFPEVADAYYDADTSF
jgi:hypothetical protein|tara:strand:- start:1627 stop:1800 length:174 start_codon:yes stop_codon:yes gene_type:complete